MLQPPTFAYETDLALPGPEFAMDNKKGRSCFFSKFSSSNFYTQDNQYLERTLFTVRPMEHMIKPYLSVNTLATCSICVGEITALQHEAFDYSMENGTFVPT